jgi:hypothetical protein
MFDKFECVLSAGQKRSSLFQCSIGEGEKSFIKLTTDFQENGGTKEKF